MDAKVGVDAFFWVVNDFWNQGKTMEIRGFGTFITKNRKPRPARNPKSGEVIQLYKRRVPLIKFSTEVKKRVNEMTAVTVDKKRKIYV
jgi:DNA-binding protein HU-beta/integration host factor subunit beta